MNGDNFVTASDALLVLNFVNTVLFPPPDPEGEALSATARMPSMRRYRRLVFESAVAVRRTTVCLPSWKIPSASARETWLPLEIAEPHSEDEEMVATSAAWRQAAVEIASEEYSPWSSRLKKSRRALE